ncbi:hypothetical protein, variant [Aphanomyces invadans]|uniref:PIPK domain-containing protein n=1 Tax=Aphanomyces invadans TaxID=157072 RepID=A0A024U1M5_9STRA|nr:hypothetical protein, variant [Aphanomyces invadans]ETV99791.1 hypothetical protein, variant [Aphanomyces invadans]|eukprot:XP_008871567.1 hypothetical protein, variant [Aphanomyces invadans]
MEPPQFTISAAEPISAPSSRNASRTSSRKSVSLSSSQRSSFFGRKNDILVDDQHLKTFDMSESDDAGNIQSLRSVVFDGISFKLTWPSFWLWLFGTSITIGTFITAYLVTDIEGHEINPGLVMGSAQTFVTSCVVIITFHGVHAFQRHPNPLLYYRAIMDLILSIRFLFDPLWIYWGIYQVDNVASCRYLSAITEFLFLSADAWFFVLTLDLYLSLNNPFTSVKRNRRIYVRGVSLFAIGLSAVVSSKQGLFGFAEGNFCWTYAKRYDKLANHTEANDFFSFNISTWVAFFSWMVLFYAFAFFVLGSSFSRLRMGLNKTMETRKGMLRDGALSIVSYTVYWTVGFSLYASSYNGGATPHQLRMDPVFKLYCYVLAGRGIVTYFLWFVINSPQLITTKWLDFSEDGIDTNISAQLNTSLQSDLLEYTVRGMLRAIYESDEIVAAAATEDANGQRPAPRLSIDSATSMSSMRLTVVDTMPQTKARVQKKGVKTPLPPAKRSVHFVNYRPSTFASLRSHFQLKTDDFVASFEEATKPSISEGASGAFMFFSKDMRFIVKSMVEAEAWFLVKIAPDYRNYMLSQPHTKLTRFFGCFKITLHGNKFYFVVMENLFANAPEIHHRYDIKGSWVNRSYDNPRDGAKVKCRYCSMQFVYHSNAGKQQTCPNLAGPHEPNVVLKDDDIHYRLRLGAAEGRALLDQLKRDSVFLRDQGIMDYSLLIGVVDVQYKVDKSDAGAVMGLELGILLW